MLGSGLWLAGLCVRVRVMVGRVMCYGQGNGWQGYVLGSG